ncbi:RNA methyltransferase [Bacillus sp. AFS076308]|uniref:TrmH family RNA methyltransferase n=1 Tax=unclassified Bacillus (in: firmicutes) TaxID=185979 RepID=UPI000BF5EF87|nr:MULTISPECIES: RNA methyltransferase [unclassified Bacillus (in: firmicutes)]PFO10199.1 RNA methyltransferase [Bacillus sp. AFS076308]PGV48540.1 RNA methyltransferase [Bacillus sp. AFS037270]
MKYIESVNNPKVKQWKKLLTKKERDKSGTFIVEGFHLVEEALKQGEQVLEIIVSDKVGLPPRWDAGSTPVTSVTEEISNSLSETEAPQGIYAVCRQSNQEVQDAKTLLLIDAVQDPGNLGTMIRTADAAGIDAVVVGRGSVDIYNSKVLRSAQGSHFHLPIIRGDLHEWIDKLHDKNIPVYGTALEGASAYTDISCGASFALIVGNEGNGVAKDLLSSTTANLYIPIFGKSESLNVAVATGILLYYLKK